MKSECYRRQLIKMALMILQVIKILMYVIFIFNIRSIQNSYHTFFYCILIGRVRYFMFIYMYIYFNLHQELGLSNVNKLF